MTCGDDVHWPSVTTEAVQDADGTIAADCLEGRSRGVALRIGREIELLQLMRRGGAAPERLADVKSEDEELCVRDVVPGEPSVESSSEVAVDATATGVLDDSQPV